MKDPSHEKFGVDMENVMNNYRQPFLLVACMIAAWPQTASALTYDIYLYRPADIAGKGISTLFERQSRERSNTG